MGGNVKAHDTIVAIYDDIPTERENDGRKWHHLWTFEHGIPPLGVAKKINVVGFCCQTVKCLVFQP